MAKSDNRAGISALVVLGSLFFLYVMFSSWGTYGSVTGGASGTLAVVWAVLFAVAATTSIGLIMMGLSGFIGGWGKEMQTAASMAVRGSSIALIALSFATGNSTFFYLTLVGFVLAWLGLGWAMM